MGRRERIGRAGLLIGGLLAMSLALVGCGVRGGLEAPPEAKAEAAAQKKAAAQAKTAEPAAATAPVPPKPHKDFVLDGLLR